MPDTTSRMAPYRRSLRRLMASTLLFISSLMLVTSVGVAQSDDLDNRALFAEEMEDNDAALSNEERYNEDQYDNDVPVNQVQQTPATGGVALLPLAGSALTAGAGGFVLLRSK